MGQSPRGAHRVGRTRIRRVPVGVFAVGPAHMTADQSNEDATTYAYKASLIGSAHRFELTDAGLSWHIAGRSGGWPYADIVSVRLSYRPISMQSRRFRADIENRNGGRIAVLSTTWQ